MTRTTTTEPGQLWEVLVPTHTNDGVKISVEHHRQWDAEVRALSGGLTIMPAAVGEWVIGGDVQRERMVPVRFMVPSVAYVISILELTMEHYAQQAVLCYKIGDPVLIRRRDA